MDKLSPTNLVCLHKWSLECSVCIEGQAVGIQKYGDQIGWGPFVQGDRIGWGPFVQRDQLIGDQLWGTKCPRTICAWDQMCHSCNLALLWSESKIHRNCTKMRTPFLVDGITFWLTKSKGRLPSDWWNLEVDPFGWWILEADSPFWGCMLMNSIGRAPI